MGGEKYGSQFIIYENDPSHIHAKALIFTDPSIQLIEMNRAANNVNKLCVFASVNHEQAVEYVKLERE